MSNDTRPVRELRDAFREALTKWKDSLSWCSERDKYHAYIRDWDRLAAVLKKSEIAPAAIESPWRRRPSSGWTAKTLPYEGAPLLIVTRSSGGDFRIGKLYTHESDAFFVSARDTYFIDDVLAWMYVPEYVDAPADLDASAEPA